ncbi:MAG TPA: OB-fold nucleic acid binding domain-containing protein, partial [Patescibacteria group bacterium]|nr:OB-fold nucleic acid binding domain-containing protein [Patescibacteria group bacterium]
TRVQDKDLNKKSLESLIKCGALDKFGDRFQMLDNLDKLLKFNKKNSPDENQPDLFAASGVAAKATLTLEPVQPQDNNLKLAWEKELLGIYVSEHPLKEVAHLLPPDITPLKNLSLKGQGETVKAAGVINKIKRVITKKGQPMIFVTLEDEAGSTEVLVFPNTLEKTKDIWLEDKIVMIEGKITDKDGVAKIIADKVSDLNNLKNQPKKLTISLNGEPDVMLKLKNLFEKYPDATEVNVIHRGQRIKIAQKVKLTDEFLEQLKELVGENNVKLET